MSRTGRVAVVGAGIAGLTAAYELAKCGIDVVVHEAADRVGGKLRTEPFAGTMLDAAPDAFLARRPEAVALCEELGLRGELQEPAATSAYLWSRGALRRVPTGQVLGVPTNIRAVARSGVLSRRGAARAALEPWLPGPRLTGDTTVGELIRRRYGDEVAERLVDPLIGGINAGHTDALSVQATAPQIAAAARTRPSLSRALRALPPPAPGPVFFTLPGGMERLAAALAVGITRHGGTLRTSSRVDRLTDLVDVADAAIVAVPAPAAAELLAPLDAGAAAELRAVEYASVTLANFAYPDTAVDRPLDASGFLVPRPEGLLMTACSWASSKWAHLSAPGRFLLRVSAGRVGDDRHESLDDHTLVRRLREELRLTMGVRGEPTEVAVHRWHRAFPQYSPGHLERMDRLQERLPRHIALAGALLGGVGIPACIGSGQAAAGRIRGAISSASR